MGDRILLVDDVQDQCDLLATVLERQGFTVTATTSAQEAIDRVQPPDGETFDVILTDLEMTEMSGLELCQRMVAARPEVPVVVITGYASVATAVAAMRVGAYDFLTKPLDAKLLMLSINRALERHRLQDEVQRLREVTESQRGQAGDIIGQSPTMNRVLELVARVAPTDASVLVQGETGTGKELIARALHKASTRAEGPFVAINCAAVPINLLESELFGHAKGAFTDAKSARSGLFVQASGGTLFLDEIGEMPADVQAKLLRALQERTVRPVGSDAEVPFDARIVTATHRDLEHEVAERRFRQDLYYRINVVRIDVPALRDRGPDILTLAGHFLRRYAARNERGALKLTSAVVDRFMSYDWPGNVRELENCMERVVALTRHDQVAIDDLPERIRTHQPGREQAMAQGPDEIVTLDEIERRYILSVIERLDGNKTKAAELLGLDRRTLYRRLEKYEADQRRAAAASGARDVLVGISGERDSASRRASAYG